MLFLIGIILFTAGSLAAQLITFTAISIIPTVLLALPVIGFWLIFAASKRPKTPEKTLPALTLFKVSIIIGLVAICIVMFVFLIVAIALFIGAGFSSGLTSVFTSNSNYDASRILTGIGIFFLILIVCMIVCFSFYYKSLLGCINGIRRGIIYNYSAPLKGVKVFSVFTYISIGFSTISTLITAFTSNIVFDSLYNNLWNEMPQEVFDIAGQYLPVSANITISSVLSIAANVGIILCIIVLNRFSNSLQPDPYL